MVDPTQSKRPFLGRGLAIYLLLFLAISLPRVLNIKQTVTIDELKWMVRSANFSYAIDNGDWANTFQRGHPGVTLMWAGRWGLKTLFPEYETLAKPNINQWQFVDLVRSNGYDIVDLLAVQRAFVVLFNTVALLISYYYARRILGYPTAVLGVLLIAFSPYYTAHSNLLQLDGLSAAFVFLSLLAFVDYQQKARWTSLLISGLAAGFSWLSRSPTLALIPAIGLISLVFAFRAYRTRNQPITLLVRKLIFVSLGWGLIGVATFVIFWPAMWVTPLESLRGVYANIFKGVVTGHRQNDFFGGGVTEAGVTVLPYYYYPWAYLWRSSPVILIGLLPATIAYVKRLRPFHTPDRRDAILSLLSFVLIFTLGMSLSSKKGDRYLLPIFGFMMFTSAGGWVFLGHWLDQKLQSGRTRAYHLVGLSTVLVFFQLLLLVQVHPYYLAYYNPLLGGAAQAYEVMQIGWGEGLDQAARYLNEKPDVEELLVASWYVPCFDFYFRGRSMDIPGSVTDAYLAALLEADYWVIYIHQWQRQLPQPVLDYVAPMEPEYVVWINGLPYVEIYNLKVNQP